MSIRQHGNLIAGSSVGSAEAKIWAEGTDEQVQALGGEKSAKGYAESIEENVQKAETAATSAENSATLAESYAKGGTETREGEDTDNAEYYAGVAQEAAEGRAKKPVGEVTAGDVAGLTEEGDLTDTGIPSSNVAQQDGYYPDMGVGTAENLIDPNATPNAASFGFRTAAGNVSITEQSNAVVSGFKGSTQIMNQLVSDSNVNTVSSSDGKASVSDAVGGNVKSLRLNGECVVMNQLVKDYDEKTISGRGRLWAPDAVAGNAKSLTMYGDAYARNQLYKYQLWEAPSDSNRVITELSNQKGSTITILAPANTSSVWLRASGKYIVGHKYMLTSKVTASYNAEIRPMYNQIADTSTVIVTASTPTVISIPFTATAANNYFVIYYNISGTAQASDTITFDELQIIDLTYLTNGDTSLADSIQTWDGLVFQYPEYASHVAYDTGTIISTSQPSVIVNKSATYTAPSVLYGVGAARDTYDIVSGVSTSRVGKASLSSLTWTAGSETYSAVISDIMPDTENILLPNGLKGTVSGTTLTVTSSSSPTGDMLYELATPTSASGTAHATTLVDRDNTFLQTDSGEKVEIALAYDGTNQTIALNPTHKYVWCDDCIGQDAITNQSSIDVVGGEDMLVDITQLYNGDSAKIALVHAWCSLSTRFHRFRDMYPYDPGTVEAASPVVKVFADEYAYGVVYDPSTTSPTCQKVELRNGVISTVSSFSSLPAHDWHRCVMDNLSTRHVNYYLDPTDSTKKYNGTYKGATSDGSASVLTGADGDVMVEMDITHWFVDEDYQGTGKTLYLVSDKPFTGSEIHPFFYVSPNGDTPRTQYVGAYRACVCDADGTPFNTTEGATSQTTGTSSTRLGRSISGALPWVSVNIADTLAAMTRNGGSMVNSLFHQYLLLMMIIEKGTLNTQSISAGYTNGKTNALWCWRKSGRTNYGNGTGQTLASDNTNDIDNFMTFKVGSTSYYRDYANDGTGYYAWSTNHTDNHAYTAVETASNGTTVYSDTSLTTTIGTTSSWSATASSSRVVQFQYHGIENPFGEVYEFEHGIQKYQNGVISSFKVGATTYYRDWINDGAASRAFTTQDSAVTVWVGLSISAGSTVYSDSSLTTSIGTLSDLGYVLFDKRYWHTSASSSYTSTAQQTANSPAYMTRRHPWPVTGYIKKFDPLTFLPYTVGGSSATYLCDYYYNNASGGACVVFRGGNAYNGAAGGLGFVLAGNGLALASVNIGSRLSA